MGASGSSIGSIARNPWEVAHGTAQSPTNPRPSISSNTWEASTFAGRQSRPAWDVAKSDYILERAPDPLADQESYWDWAWGKADAARQAIADFGTTAAGVAGPAFRRQNSLGSLHTRLSDPLWYEPVPGYRVTDRDIRGYEQFSGRLSASRSPAETADIKKRIDAELDDQRLLDEAGWVGDIMEGLVAVADPINFVPIGGAAYRGYKVAHAVGGAVARGAGYGIAGETISEGIFQSTQETRTAAESMMNIGAGIVPAPEL